MTKAKPPAVIGRAARHVRSVVHHGIHYAATNTTVSNTMPMNVMLVIFIIFMTVVTGSLIPAVVIGGGLLLCVIGGLLSVGAHIVRTEPGKRIAARKSEIKDARNHAQSTYGSLVQVQDPNWLPHFNRLRTIISDEKAGAIGDDLALRLRDLKRVYDKAIQEAGRADISRIAKDAQEAAKAIAQAAIEEYDLLDAHIRASDEKTAPDVAREFAETARRVAGLRAQPDALPPPSASAALQRLIGLAEDALKVDPDLVDGQGARVDSLVRKHLPRLLEVHADAARVASGEDLANVDARLADGVEQVRASVEEALMTDARHRFDLLETEVRFLRMRRGL